MMNMVLVTQLLSKVNCKHGSKDLFPDLFIKVVYTSGFSPAFLLLCIRLPSPGPKQTIAGQHDNVSYFVKSLPNPISWTEDLCCSLRPLHGRVCPCW